MPALDHVNLQTTRLAESVAFYRNVIGLEVRDPPGLDPTLIQWMFDDQGRGILHLATVGSLTDAPAGPADGGTGAVHHVALACEDHHSMTARLDAHGLSYRLNQVPSIDLKQIFVQDPNGVLLELNFYPGKH